MLEEIKRDLAENFRQGEEKILQDIIDEVTTNALTISNRKSTNLLKGEIKKCVKSIYLQRGAEGSNSLSSSGVSTSFNNATEIMRTEIVKSGKRVPFI